MSNSEELIEQKEIPIVQFQIGNVNFGLDVYQIRDIIRLDDITRVPNCPDYIMGVINLRGAIIPVINLRKRLSFDNINYQANCRILICEFGEEVAGLIVDSVSEVTMLPTHNIEPRPRYLVNNIDSNYLVGLGRKEEMKLGGDDSKLAARKKSEDAEFILLLDLGKILNLKLQQRDDSVIKNLVSRKEELLAIEREKIKAEILQLKEKEKETILSSLDTSNKKLAQAVKAKEDTFKARQAEVIKKIQQSRGEQLKLAIKKASEKDILKLGGKTNKTVVAKPEKTPTEQKRSPSSQKNVKKVRKVIIRKKKDTSKTSSGSAEVKFGKIKLPEKELEITTPTEKIHIPFDKLDEMQLSLIQEIGNIGAGNAATALSSMIDKRVDISVPRVKMCPTEQMAQTLGGSDQLSIAIYLNVEGDVSMYMMLVFKRPSGLRLADMLLFQERSEEELESNDPLEQMDESALTEVGNILGSHYLTALSEFTGLHMIPGPPSLAYDMLGSVIDFIQIELEEEVETALILNTDIIVERETIEGYILILPIPESIKSMLGTMGLMNK